MPVLLPILLKKLISFFSYPIWVYKISFTDLQTEPALARPFLSPN